MLDPDSRSTGSENPGLTDELLAEAPAIFNWALEGLDRLRERGYFVTPTSAREAQRHLEDLASPVGAFVRDMLRRRPGLRGRQGRALGGLEAVVRRRGRDARDEGGVRPRPARGRARPDPDPTPRRRDAVARLARNHSWPNNRKRPLTTPDQNEKTAPSGQRSDDADFGSTMRVVRGGQGSTATQSQRRGISSTRATSTSAPIPTTSTSTRAIRTRAHDYPAVPQLQGRSARPAQACETRRRRNAGPRSPPAPPGWPASLRPRAQRNSITP